MFGNRKQRADGPMPPKEIEAMEMLLWEGLKTDQESAELAMTIFPEAPESALYEEDKAIKLRDWQLLMGLIQSPSS